MNEQEHSATSIEAAIETANPEKKSGQSEHKPESKPKSRKGAVGKIACPICSEKWHPRKHGDSFEFYEAHKKEHARENLGYADFRVKEHSSAGDK